MSAFLASHNFGKHPIMTEVRNKRKLFPLFPDNTLKWRGGDGNSVLTVERGVLHANTYGWLDLSPPLNTPENIFLCS